MQSTPTMENTRDFKGIWIPAEIWLNPELNFTEKALYAEIDSLDGEGGCFASNEYFAKFFGISERAIQNGLSHLKSLGFVSQESFNGRSRCLRATRRKLHGRGEENFTSGVKKISPIYNNIENSIYKSPLTPQGEEMLSSQSLGEKTESLCANPASTEPTPPVRRRPPSPNSAEEDKDFDAFWAAYPKCERKSGKADCRAIWKARKLSSVKDKLMIALEIDKASRDWAKNSGQYIPFPKTWLNKKRYADIDDSVVAEKKNVCSTTTSVNSWSVLTYDDVELGRATEWLDKFRAGTPPSWSIRDDEWVSKNRDLIIKAEKI